MADTMEIQRIKIEYYKKMCAKMENMGERDKFRDTYDLQI